MTVTAEQSAASNGRSVQSAPRLNATRAQRPLVPLGRPSTAQPQAAVSFQGPVGVVRCVSPVEMTSIVDRLYRKGMEDLQRHKDATAERAISPSSMSACGGRAVGGTSVSSTRPASASMILTADEVKESVNRLYYSGIKHKLDAHKRLAEKYLFHRSSRRQENVSAGELRDRVVQRFYTDEQLRAKKAQEELYKTYIESTAPKVPRRSRDEISSIIDRLCSSK